jgi:hypothetical protein
MSGDRNVSLPVAALGVLAFFFSTALLTQHAFDLLRLSEGDTIKERPLAQPPVEARLWEDPLAATVRHQDRLNNLCSKPGNRPALCPPDNKYRPDLSISSDADRLTVIAALVPGSSFVGVEEARRRMRYAMLSGLASKGFVPENSERLGLLTVPLCDSFHDCPAAGKPDGKRSDLNVPYETLTTDDSGARRRIAILWLDDSKLGEKWLRKVVVLLGTVIQVKTEKLSIIGPYTSDKLVDAMEDVAELAQGLDSGKGETAREGDPKKRQENFCAHWQRLQRVDLVSPYSTADARQLIKAAKFPTANGPVSTLPKDCEERASRIDVQQHARAVTDPIDRQFQQLFSSRQAALVEPFFLRTIGSDAVQIAQLHAELCARGLDDGNGGRIVILREWDSIYARSLADKLGKTLECAAGKPSPRGHEKTKFDLYSYFAGIDGITLEGVSKQQRLVPRADGDKKRDEGKEPQLEWPENRDQRDYVRRLVNQLQQEAEADRRNTVRAVGIIGQDVHDKLVLTQALRPAFPERMIFTTDLDARLLHPEVTRYTRNLVIASALPLSVSELDPPAEQSVKVPPFRDIYQTATYLAARHAVSGADGGSPKAAASTALQKSYLYEIGRHGAAVKLASRSYRVDPEDGIKLAPDEPLPDQMEVRRFYAILLFAILIAFGGFIVFVQPGPALREAISGDLPFDVSTMTISGLTAASWGFAAGVVAELAMPGRIGLGGAFVTALAATLLFWIAVYPGPRPGRVPLTAGTSWRWITGQRLLRATLFILVIGGGYLLIPGASAGTHEPLAFFSGVSSWPSELLRALAILLFGWFVDYTWRGTAETTRQVGAKYFDVKTVPKTRLGSVVTYFRRNPERATNFAWRRVVKGLRDATLWMWHPQISRRSDQASARRLLDDTQPTTTANDGGIDGTRIWRRYIRLLHGGPRFLRTVMWLFAVFCFALLETKLFGGESPEVPARGIGDRTLFYWTTVMAVVAAIILMVLVSDATILTWRFIRILRNKRTIYPQETIRRFAAELGPELADRAARPIAARVRDRTTANRQRRNSILDPWIDARLLADHTDAIARLIFFPLILLGLLFLARSPLFDNWSSANVVIVVLVSYLLWTIAMATMLNISAEMARRTALEAMRNDLLWLQGSGEKYRLLAERLPSLITQVEQLRKGAFAPFFEQPLVRAVLVPLGGAGGLQLLELLSFARS